MPRPWMQGAPKWVCESPNWRPLFFLFKSKPLSRRRCFQHVDWRARDVDWDALLDRAQSWPDPEYILVHLAFDLFQPFAGSITALDLSELDQEHLRLAMQALVLHRHKRMILWEG